jgi:EF-hand domain pair
VAAFTVIDQSKHGYIDFEALRKFLGKFKKDVKKSDVNAIIRRMDLDADGKITFREFAHGITPEYPGTPVPVGTESPHTVVNPEFNVERKEEVRKNYEDQK